MNEKDARGQKSIDCLPESVRPSLTSIHDGVDKLQKIIKQHFLTNSDIYEKISDDLLLFDAHTKSVLEENTEKAFVQDLLQATRGDEKTVVPWILKKNICGIGGYNVGGVANHLKIYLDKIKKRDPSEYSTVVKELAAVFQKMDLQYIPLEEGKTFREQQVDLQELIRLKAISFRPKELANAINVRIEKISSGEPFLYYNPFTGQKEVINLVKIEGAEVGSLTDMEKTDVTEAVATLKKEITVYRQSLEQTIPQTSEGEWTLTKQEAYVIRDNLARGVGRLAGKTLKIPSEITESVLDELFPQTLLEENKRLKQELTEKEALIQKLTVENQPSKAISHLPKQDIWDFISGGEIDELIKVEKIRTLGDLYEWLKIKFTFFKKASLFHNTDTYEEPLEKEGLHNVLMFEWIGRLLEGVNDENIKDVNLFMSQTSIGNAYVTLKNSPNTWFKISYGYPSQLGCIMEFSSNESNKTTKVGFGKTKMPEDREHPDFRKMAEDFITKGIIPKDIPYFSLVSKE